MLFIVVLFAILLRKTEGFGFSNGTLIQLASSHVPTKEELEEDGA